MAKTEARVCVGTDTPTPETKKLVLRGSMRNARGDGATIHYSADGVDLFVDLTSPQMRTILASLKNEGDAMIFFAS